ncbi:O-antigen ligase family protein [Patescibacteria group bacterium]|nr:O-antigen ligase family protein [Patescibacteria group bacterium]
MTKKILRVTLLGGLFLVPFIAFIVPTAMYFPFIAGKGFAFRILVEILFGLYVMLAALDPEYRPRASKLTWSVLFFGGAILVADLLGVNVYKSLWSNYERMEGFVLILHLLMYYFVASSILNTKSRWMQFWNVSIIASVIMSLYGVLQLIGKFAINQGGTRVDATFGNAAYLSIYLVFHIFLCLYMLAGEVKESWHKWAYGLAALLETFILYFTATRGAILGLVGGLLLAGIILAWKERENKWVRQTAYGLIGAVAVLVIGMYSIRNTAYVAKSQVLSRFSTLSVSEFKTQGRYFVWPMALKGVAEHPIFGWGQENFNFVFNKNYNPAMFGQEEWFDRTHNVVLDWMVAGGIVGFAAYVSMFVALLYYIWRKESNFKLAEKAIFTGMIAAYIFHNMFVFDNLLTYILFFSLLAFVHSLSVRRELPAGKFYTETLSSDNARYSMMGVVAVLALAMVYFVNIPAIFANQTLIQAMTPQQTGGIEQNLALFKKVYAYNSFGSGEATEQLVQVTSQIASPNVKVSEDLKKQFYDFAKLKIEQKVSSSPHDARYLAFAGSFFNRFGQYDDAIKYLDRSIVESPKKLSLYFELGNSYIGKADYVKAFETFKKAYELNPNVLESKIIYAIGALYTKNAAVLKELAPQIDPNVIINDNRFLKAYVDIGDYNSVIAILNARIAKDPNNLQYQLSLASAYATIGQKQKAIDIIRAIIAKEPTFKAQGEEYIKQIQAGK